VCNAVEQLEPARRPQPGRLSARAVDEALPTTCSARRGFIYLLSLAYNGLWRVNAAGEYNVAPDPAA